MAARFRAFLSYATYAFAVLCMFCALPVRARFLRTPHTLWVREAERPDRLWKTPCPHPESFAGRILLRCCGSSPANVIRAESK